MNNNRQFYMSPKTKTEKIFLLNRLLLSSGHTQKKEDKLETRCPFNNKWCKDKQYLLNEWQHAVEVAAMTGKDYTFHTYPGMFDKCPNGYASLCYSCGQKQRD